MRGFCVIVLVIAPVFAACQQPPSEIVGSGNGGTGGGFPWEDAAPPRMDGATDGAATIDGGPPPDVGGPLQDAGGDTGTPPAPGFTILVLPDTQYYSSNFPYIFDAQTDWIVAEHRLGNVAFVLTVGDIVDDDVPGQWANASRALHKLDGVVPYVLVAGNHDYFGAGWMVNRETMIDSFFPLSTFEATASFKGTFEPGKIANHYQLFDVPGGSPIGQGSAQWLVLSLEFGPRDEVLAWADTIVKQYAPIPAIIATHAYLYDDNTRYDNVLRPQQNWSPYDYPIGATPGAVNDGEQMWQKLVLPNPNIRFVFCGHVINDGVGRLTSTRPDGSVVHQVLADYQLYALGGGGFLRVMQFFPSDRAVHIRTYSPLSNEFKADPENDFVLEY
jgi:hypothetical protein